MIRALLEHAERYYVLGEGVKMALEYIRGTDLLAFIRMIEESIVSAPTFYATASKVPF